MPSIVIHSAVAKKVGDRLGINSKDYQVGAISPDLSKLIGNPREYSHFVEEKDGPPNLDRFLYKYKDSLKDDFVLGYFVHLYTDFLFEKYFVSNFLDDGRNTITKADGTEFKYTDKTYKLYLYNDYTNLNEQLISKYNIDYSFLDEPYETNKWLIEEVPISEIEVLFKATKEIIANSKKRKDFLFNIKDMVAFIDFASILISQRIEELVDINN